MVTASAAGITTVCGVMRARTAAVEGAGQCGVSADVFRYLAAIVPATSTGRSVVTWTTTIATGANIAPIPAFKGLCPTVLRCHRWARRRLAADGEWAAAAHGGRRCEQLSIAGGPSTCTTINCDFAML